MFLFSTSENIIGKKIRQEHCYMIFISINLPNPKSVDYLYYSKKTISLYVISILNEGEITPILLFSAQIPT